jgi:hypothetical protein
MLSQAYANQDDFKDSLVCYQKYQWWGIALLDLSVFIYLS